MRIKAEVYLKFYYNFNTSFEILNETISTLTWLIQ